MGIINYKTEGNDAQKNELRRRMKLAREQQAVPPPKEFEQIKKIQEQQKLQQLKIFDYIDGKMGVGFGVGFDDENTYYSAQDLEK